MGQLFRGVTQTLGRGFFLHHFCDRESLRFFFKGFVFGRFFLLYHKSGHFPQPCSWQMGKTWENRSLLRGGERGMGPPVCTKPSKFMENPSLGGKHPASTKFIEQIGVLLFSFQKHRFARSTKFIEKGGSVLEGAPFWLVFIRNCRKRTESHLFGGFPQKKTHPH